MYPLKFVGVIVTLFVPDVDTLIIVLICPFAPSANEQGAAADVAFTSVIGVVTLIAVDVEPSPVIDCVVAAILIQFLHMDQNI